MLNTDYKPKGNVSMKTKEITLSYGIHIIFQIPIRKNSKFKVPVIVSHQATERFITHWSDKERGTLADTSAPLGALGLDVCLRETEHQPQQNLSFQGKQACQTK